MKTATARKIASFGKNPMQLRTEHVQKMGARRDGGGNKNAIRYKFASVDCEKHGRYRELTKKKEVYIGRGRNKREIYGGCPECAKERREAATP